MGRMQNTDLACEFAENMDHAYDKSRHLGDSPGEAYERMMNNNGRNLETDLRIWIARYAVGQELSDNDAEQMVTPQREDLGSSYMSLRGAWYWATRTIVSSIMTDYDRLQRRTHLRDRQASAREVNGQTSSNS